MTEIHNKVQHGSTLIDSPKETKNSVPDTSNVGKKTDRTNNRDSAKKISELQQEQSLSSTASPLLEQVKRFAELREVLMSGDTEKNSKNDALALDLLGVIKNNLRPESTKLEEHKKLLNELEGLITDKKFADSNKKISEIIKSFENEEKALNFSPTKNLEGGGFATIIDTAIQHLLGNVAGPATVKFVEKTLGIPIKKANLGSAEIHAEVGAGITGFQAAELLIGGHMLGLPFKIPGWNGIDPIFENTSKKLNKWIETKVPNFKINFNKTVDGFVKKLVNTVTGILGKNNNPVQAEGTKIYHDELQEEIDNYIKNRHTIEHDDPEARAKLVKKMVHADFENQTGKKMMKPLQLAMNYAFKTTDNGHPTKHSLLMNELALAVKPYLDKLGPVGKVAYNFLYWIVPNHYIFGFRPLGQYILNDKEKYLVDRANEIKENYQKPLEVGSAH